MSHHQVTIQCHSSLVSLKAVFSVGSVREGRQLLQDKTSSFPPSRLLLLSFFIKYLLTSIMNETLYLELGMQYREEQDRRGLCHPGAYSLARKKDTYMTRI